jgi:hypothetical protein
LGAGQGGLIDDKWKGITMTTLRQMTIAALTQPSEPMPMRNQYEAASCSQSDGAMQNSSDA